MIAKIYQNSKNGVTKLLHCVKSKKIGTVIKGMVISDDSQQAKAKKV